ncbi:hypothetical protein NLU13_8781 [Sarocladium strictum]|uniref:feruloyl esterase n=1 Tax=Sarocladium strictum TaxID=5046 RepID=A0AA39L3Q6_SARSR|nr:hypothetical protein NLU13_8781 [Sarocladium strictum]
MRLALFVASLYGSNALAAYTGDTSGCGRSHASNTTQAWSLTSRGSNRTYYVHVPEDYSATKQYPTIVGFHGRSGSGLFFEADTGLSQAQFTGETIMVYPDGVDKTWAGASYSAVSVEEDLQFVWELLAQVRRDYCVDSARISATGHSNGGGLVNLIACNATVGAEFAAFAAVSGAFYEDQEESLCEPARRLTPMLEIHGGKDDVISYNGGKGHGGEIPSIPDWLERWAKRDDCVQKESVEIFDGQVEHLTWQCRGKSGALQHYKVKNGGKYFSQHSWATADPSPSQRSYADPPVPINASTIVPQFLQEYERPPAK